MFKGLLLSIYFTAIFFTLQAQNVRYITYNSRNNGLSNNLTKAVTQDSLGFIWVATDEGLSRFDGISFQNFIKGLPSNYVKSFLKTHNGTLLAATDNGIVKIISKPDTAYFLTIIKGSNEVTDSTVNFPKLMFEYSQDNIWITDNQGIVCYKNNNLKRYAFNKTFKIINYQRTFSIVETTNGNIFAFSPDGFTFYLDKEIDKFVEIKEITQFKGVNYAIATGDNSILLATSLGIYELTADQKNKVVSLKNIFPFIDASYIAEKNENEFIVSTWVGYVYTITKKDNKYEANKFSYLSVQKANCLYIDTYKNIFISTDEGILLIQRTQFLAETNKSYQSYINSMCLLSGNEIWATNYGSILKINYKEDSIITSQIPHPVFAGDISTAVPSKIKNNSYWLSTNAAMLYFVVNNKIEKTIDLSDIGKNMFNCMEDNEQNLWGCVDGLNGVVKISKSYERTLYDTNKGVNKRFIVIKQRNDGAIFGGACTDSNYLYMYDKKNDKFINISKPINFKTNNELYINDITFRETIVWLATTHGVLKYDGTKIERLDLGVFTERNTFSLATDSKGSLWFSNSKGILKYINNQTVLFDENNGLSNLTATYRCFTIDSLNHLWLGTSLGINFSENTNETKITPSPLVSNVYINKNKDQNSFNKITFTKGSYLTINYFSLSFPGNEIFYQYKLSGENDQWIDIQSKTELILPDIPTGKHNLQIRAKQQGNYYWSMPYTLELEIIRPWFLRWWAFILYIFIFTTIVYFIVQINSYRLQKQKEELEQVVKERTNEVVFQKNEILEKNEDLLQNMEELRTLNENIENQKNIIEDANSQLQKQATELSEKNATLEQFNFQLKKYYTVLEQSPTAVVITDINGIMEYVNPFFTKLTGYTAEEAKGQNPKILQSDKTPKETFSDLWQTILNGKIWEGMLTNKKKDNSLFIEHALIAPIFDHEKIINFVAIKEDVTELKRAEQLILESLDTTKKQKIIIEQAHKNIIDSINYAKRIQTAILPNNEFVSMLFPEHFIFSKARDIVSGDFYFIKQAKNYTFIAVADCTGHGVPGAIMSMLGVALLNEIVRNKEISSSAEVLNELRKQIKNSLQQTGQQREQQDGLDIAFASINMETMELSFAGAHNPLFLITQNKLPFTNDDNVKRNNLVILEADRQPVGIFTREKPFTEHSIQLQTGDILYMFSDGYYSQFGGVNGGKIKYKGFQEIILRHIHEPMQTQGLMLEQEFEQWRGNKQQVDDVLVIGVKI